MKSSHSKRIGIVTWDFRNAKGGLGRALEDIAATLLSAGHTVEVFAPSEGYFSFTHKMGGHLLFSLLIQWRLHSWIRERNIETLFLPVGPGGVFLFRKPACSLFSIVYHTYAQQSRDVPGHRWKIIFVPLERRTLSFARRIFVYSGDTHSSIAGEYPELASHTVLLPQLLDSQAWNTSGTAEKEEYLCVCIARLEARKGIPVLLRAWQEIIQAVPEARLILIGDGVQRTRIDRLIGGLSGTVRRIAQVPFPELVSTVQRAAVALCPSYLEGFGLAVAEAMLSRTAVVASNADGHRFLIRDGETGLLFKSGDTHALADAAVGLLRDAETRSRIAKQAHDDILSRFDRVSAEEALLSAIATG